MSLCNNFVLFETKEKQIVGICIVQRYGIQFFFSERSIGLKLHIVYTTIHNIKKITKLVLLVIFKGEEEKGDFNANISLN